MWFVMAPSISISPPRISACAPLPPAPIVIEISVNRTCGRNGKATVLLSTFKTTFPGSKALPSSTCASRRLPAWMSILWATIEMSPEAAAEGAVAGSPPATMLRVETVAPPLAVKLSDSTSNPPAAETLALASTLTVSTQRVLIVAPRKSSVPKAAVSTSLAPSTSKIPVIWSNGARTVLESTWVTPVPAVMPVESVTTRFVPSLENVR